MIVICPSIPVSLFLFDTIKRIKVLSILFLFFVLFNPPILLAQETPKILFLTFKIVKAKGPEEYRIQLLNKIIVNGKLKSETTSTHVSEKLVFTISDAKQQFIKRLEIDNPLNTPIESFDPDGTMHRHVAVTDSTEFTVRFPYLNTMRKLTLQSQNQRLNKQNLSNFTMDL